MQILFKNARLIDPELKLDSRGSLLVRDNHVGAVFDNDSGADALGDNMRVIECGGAILCPGLVDLHVHFRDPGLTEKECLETGCAAAAAGGFTSVVTMANTKPAIDTPELVRDCIERNKSMPCRIHPAAAVTKNLAGKELVNFAVLKDAGAVAFTDDGMTVNDNALFYHAMELAAELGLPVSVHCEAAGFEGDRSMNRGEVSRSLNLLGTPALAEELIIQRDLLFAEKTGAHLHVQHLSTARGVEMVREAKARGVNVTAEATPHHMSLDESAVLECGTNAKMSPPLRLPSDVIAVRQALMDGVLDVIATDHAPHTPSEKAQGMVKAPNGIIGLETALAVCVTELCHKNNFALSDLIDRMSAAPRRAFDLPRVNLKQGSIADLVLFDPDSEVLVDPEKFYSRARNCPWAGKKLNGKVLATVLAGEIVYENL